MKILIISKFFYPENTPRAFRTTEMALELQRRGNEVTLALPEQYKTSVESYGLHFASLGKETKEFKGGIFAKILNRLFHILIDYPDILFLFSVYRFLLKNKNDYDVLFSIAFPHSIHWGIGFARKKIGKTRFPKTWIADCGDPYMGNKLIKPLPYFKFFERTFCKYCDAISIPIESARDCYYQEYSQKIHIIPQGFRFEQSASESYQQNEIPTFIYGGTFYKNIRDPRPLLDYLSSLDIDFRFIIYSDSDLLVKPYYDVLEEKLEFRGLLRRDELLKEFAKADFLINIENGTDKQNPSKLIDYAISKRPVLNISSNNFDRQRLKEFLNFNFKNQTPLPDLENYKIENVMNKFMKLVYEKF